MSSGRPGLGPPNKHLSNDGKASGICQTHLRPPLGMMLFPHSGGEGAKSEVSRLSEVILPGKLWWLKFFFLPRTPSFLPSFTSFLLLPPTVSPPPLSFPLPLSVFLFFFSSKKHLSHSHRYSFSRSLPASCKATDSDARKLASCTWDEKKKKKKKHKE